MYVFKFFIERPIFATVLALLFVVAGLCYIKYIARGGNVSRYCRPPCKPAVYPGANR